MNSKHIRRRQAQHLILLVFALAVVFSAAFLLNYIGRTNGEPANLMLPGPAGAPVIEDE